MTKLMSDARQTQLVEATRKAADLHLDGVAASEAVAKCAGEIGANPHVLQRMVEAFNTAKTLAHFKTADSHERAESFELADYETARKQLFPEGDQAKAARAELDPGEIPDPLAGTEKAASEGIPEVLRVEAPVRELDQDRRYSLAFRSLDQMRKVAQDHRLEGERFRITLEGAVQKLASIFRQAERPDWATFEAEARALYKEAAAPFLDLAYEQGKLASIKLARDGAKLPVYVNTSTEAHKLLKIAMYAADLAAEEFAASQKVAAEMAQSHAELVQMAKHAAEKTAIDPVMGFMAFQGMHDMLGKAMDKHVEESIPKDKPTADFSSDVGVESELSKAKMQATLRDLMEGDDVVAQHAKENPQVVTQAMQDLTRMSPDIANNPMLLRGALRRQLEMGQLEPFELKQIQDVAQPKAQVGGK